MLESKAGRTTAYGGFSDFCERVDARNGANGRDKQKWWR